MRTRFACIVALVLFSASEANAQNDQKADNPSVWYSAVRFADAAAPKDTATHAAILRKALSLLDAAGAFDKSQATSGERDAVARRSMETSIFDADPRFRANLLDFVQTASEAAYTEDDRIWGGRPTKDFPEVVAITGNERICTGVLVSDKAVLTAAHCWCGGINRVVQFGSDLLGPAIKVVGGKPRAGCGANRRNSDIAYMLLGTPTTLRPATIATTLSIDEAKQVRAVGFGRTDTGEIGQKMVADITVATPSCAGTVRIGRRDIDDDIYYGCNRRAELVAREADRSVDTCNGDSGGPIYVRQGDGRLALAGTTSRAVTTTKAQKCGEGGIYVRVDGNVLGWLRDEKILK